MSKIYWVLSYPKTPYSTSLGYTNLKSFAEKVESLCQDPDEPRGQWNAQQGDGYNNEAKYASCQDMDDGKIEMGGGWITKGVHHAIFLALTKGEGGGAG